MSAAVDVDDRDRAVGGRAVAAAQDPEQPARPPGAAGAAGAQARDGRPDRPEGAEREVHPHEALVRADALVRDEPHGAPPAEAPLELARLGQPVLEMLVEPLRR